MLKAKRIVERKVIRGYKRNEYQLHSSYSFNLILSKFAIITTTEVDHTLINPALLCSVWRF
jgi:hypothetical protein